MAIIEHPRADAAAMPRPANRTTPRHSMFTRARVFPVTQMTGFGICGLSDSGVTGEAAIDLLLSHNVHYSEDGRDFREGRVCWVNGHRFGLARVRKGFVGGILPIGEAGIIPDADRGRSITPSRRGMLAVTQPMIGAIIRNMSDGGVMLETMRGIPGGTPLLIAFDAGRTIYGHVRWQDGRKSGIQFAAPLPCRDDVESAVGNRIAAPGIMDGLRGDELGRHGRIEAGLYRR